MSGHVPLKCTHRKNLTCPRCRGEVFECSQCGGFRGDDGEVCSLPTDCPGEWMTSAQYTDVSYGRVDYRDGSWLSTPLN